MALAIQREVEIPDWFREFAPMFNAELAYMPATELADKIRNKEVSPTEVIENVFARIAEIQPKLNPFTDTYYDAARDRARQSDQDIQSGKDLGPLHGIPFAVKDFTPTLGHRTTRGSLTLAHWVPDFNPVLVDRLQRAGAILIGKTTTSEFAFSGFTESKMWGVTKNPWDANRSPGGSSGGSAVAVATGCVPIAEGTDMGGSVRIPAAFCGVVGLKPSLGRIPMDILPTVFDSISHFGPITRTVADSALFLDVTHGPHETDIQSIGGRFPGPLKVDADISGMRLAYSVNLGFYAVDREVERNFLNAIDVLRNRGAIVQEVDVKWDKTLVDVWNEYWSVFQAAFAGGHVAGREAEVHPELFRLVETGKSVSAVQLRRSEIIRTCQWRQLAAILEDFSCLLCPTTTVPAPPLGGNDSDYDYEDETGLYHGLDMTCIFNNVAACPCLAVPSGFTNIGLPTGIQIVSRRFDEISALRVGAVLDEDIKWTSHRPPVCCAT